MIMALNEHNSIKFGNGIWKWPRQQTNNNTTRTVNGKRQTADKWKRYKNDYYFKKVSLLSGGVFGQAWFGFIRRWAMLGVHVLSMCWCVDLDAQFSSQLGAVIAAQIWSLVCAMCTYRYFQTWCIVWCNICQKWKACHWSCQILESVLFKKSGWCFQITNGIHLVTSQIRQDLSIPGQNVWFVLCVCVFVTQDEYILSSKVINSGKNK